MKKAKTRSRWWRIPDAVWERIEPLLPKRPKRDPSIGDRPPVPDRQAMNGISFVLRTGCQWNALNETGICSSSTAHLRFQQWRKTGVFEKLWASGLNEYDELKGIDWALAVDGWRDDEGAGEKNRAKSDGPSQRRRQAKPVV